MNKKIFTLFVLLLLLPVTALAAEEIKLFIGGQQITESGCYENKNGTWTKVDGTEPANGQFYYDAATFTLTLNEAEITNNQTVNVAEGYTYDGSVIAFSQTAEVSLKIVVSQGTSTITGKGGIRVESTTGNASLSIKGSGSLDVEPKESNSGITLCSSKNTNLDIDGADVTASSPALYGVYLISSTDASSTSTITVNNGSLTTGGNGNVGIYYYWSGTNNAGTSSLTVSGNAVVDTRNSQIMAQNKETVVQVGAGSDGNGGIVFNGKSGTVYGDVTLQENLEIGKDETLTIPEGTTLTIPQGMTLTNYGTLTSYGTVINQGTLDGNGTITCQHHTGGTATCIQRAKCSLCGTKYGNLAPHTLTKKEAQAPTCTEPGNIAYWICSVCNKLFRDEAGTHEITEGETVDPATDHDWKITYTWSEDNTTCTAKQVCQHDASHTETATATVTSEPTKTPTCTEKGEMTYTATFSETWAETQTTTEVIDATGHGETEIQNAKEATCTEDGYTGDEVCTVCGEVVTAGEIIPATGHHYVNGYCTECGHRDPDYRPDPISYYNIYVEDVCDGVEVSTSKQVVREGGSINVYVEKDTANYTFDNFHVYYKEGYYDSWDELKEGTQPGEYPIKNIWTHIYIKAEGAEEKEDPTGIESIEGVKVYTKDGSLYVQTPQREQIIIVSMSGAVVKNEEQIGLKQYHGLQPGIYIVRVGDKAYKVRLN